MTASIYAEGRAALVDALAEFGRSATWRTTTSAGDAWNPTQTVADVTIQVITPSVATLLKTGLVTSAGSAHLLCSAAVEQGDSIIDGEVFTVKEVVVVKPGPTEIMRILELVR